MFSHVHQVILKVTRGCNLACKYCYVKDKPEYNNEEMTDEVYDFAMRRWMSESKRNDLSLVFHGGEPLRIGKEKFSRFCVKAQQYAIDFGKTLEIGIQTNATLIDDEWAAIFNQYNVGIGVSWDGINPKVDYRNNTHDLVLSKLKMLKEYNIQNAGPLMVLCRGNMDSMVESFDALMEIGVNNIKINRGVDIVNRSTADSDFEMTAEQLVKAFDVTVDYMIKTKLEFEEQTNLGIVEKFIQSKHQGREYDPNLEESHCYTRYCGGMRNLMEFEPDGTFQFCGRQSVRNMDIGGNIYDRDFLELKLIWQQANYNAPKTESINKYRCNECYAQSICDGGCIAYSDQKLGTPIIDPGTHQYFRLLGLYLIKNGKKIQELFDLSMKRNQMNAQYKSQEEDKQRQLNEKNNQQQER